ncbi:TPA: LamG domain-containing protein [bacterium]|nr:LamG domain-containing protein [bacterium]
MRFFCVVLLLMLVLTSPIFSAVNTKGLVVYLPFDDGKGKTAVDASGNGNNGDFQGDASWVDGKFGKAVSVSDKAANNMVVIKANPSLDITQALTLMAWVNLGAIPDTYNGIITKAETYMLHTDEQGGVRVDPLVWFGGSYGTWPSSAAVLVPHDEWHHVAGVFNGKNIVTYLDGKPGTPFARAGEIDVTQADVVIGRDSRGCCNTRKSAQIIDEVMIWSRALNEAEVNELMKNGGKVAFAVDPNGKLTSKWGQIKSDY